MQRTGGCLCGAVRYTAEVEGTGFGACHCSMCRRWTGGPLLNVRASSIRFEGTPSRFRGSEWAERGFCATCGSSLFYRLVKNPEEGPIHVTFGSLDDVAGLTFTHQVFIDDKPDGYAFANETRTMTAAQVLAMFAS